MKNMSAADVVDRFSKALDNRDFTTARALLADDLRFQGPIDRFERADDYVKAISGLYQMVKGVEHQRVIAQGQDVASFYVLDTPVAKAAVAEWYRVKDGRIREIRTYFDARPFAAAAARQS